MSDAIADKLIKLGALMRKPNVAAANITKAMDHEKLTDMKHDRFEIVNSNFRQVGVQHANKEKLKRQRHTQFLGQE